mgnify:CR=1 FL=1
MKAILALLFVVPILAFAQKTPQGVTYDAKIVRVNDGDTVVISAPFLPAPLKPELAVRIYGVDTPEKGHLAKCQREKDRAAEARKFVEDRIAAAKRVQVLLIGWDKYGGRVLGDLIIDGEYLSLSLIINNYAVMYNGHGRKKDWCN